MAVVVTMNISTEEHACYLRHLHGDQCIDPFSHVIISEVTTAWLGTDNMFSRLVYVQGHVWNWRRREEPGHTEGTYASFR